MVSIATNLDPSVLATLLKASKRLAHLDVGEHVSDQKADIVVPLVDGIRLSREFSQDPLVDKLNCHHLPVLAIHPAPPSLRAVSHHIC